MDAVSANTRLAKGLSKIAAKIGRGHRWFRPANAMSPTADVRVQGVLQAYFDVDPMFRAKKPSKEDNNTFYGALDLSRVAAGDYLILPNPEDEDAPLATYFVSAIYDIQPPEIIRCNMTASFYRPAAEAAPEVGPDEEDDSYEGNTLNGGKGLLLALDWPIGLLEGTKGERPKPELPTGPNKRPWFKIAVPHLLGVTLRAGDFIELATGERLSISSPVLTEHGYRITAGEVE